MILLLGLQGPLGLIEDDRTQGPGAASPMFLFREPKMVELRNIQEIALGIPNMMTCNCLSDAILGSLGTLTTNLDHDMLGDPTSKGMGLRTSQEVDCK